MQRSLALRAAAAAALIALALASRHAALAQAGGSLTAMDYIEIQQLVHKLSFALDYCTNGGRDFADLFVDGGQYTIDRGDGKPTIYNTREDLAKVAGGPDCEAVKSPPRSYVLHLSESLVIEPSPDGARGKSYAIYPANKGKYLQDDVAGQVGFYHDEYVKTADGWRFKSRRHELNPVVGE
jgi:SnoaL-like protein